MKNIYSYSFILIFVWLGFLVAISFMEAPLKFQAPSVTTAIGVEIGRIVFNALNTVEIIFSIYLLVQLNYFRKLDHKIFIGVVLLLMIIGVQSFYLLPVLDSYATIVINGGISPSNIEHVTYVVLEVIKVILLPYIGYRQVIMFKK
ncbi:hypothetical protein [Aquimarina longa]|uniref:hypothetical protein n=1 Tax=Aquimarina longa TaxID=1080221 RepID=UPI000781E3EF|nr:hypothetical protein [Aquimarina longa]